MEILIAMLMAAIIALALNTAMRQAFAVVSHADHRRPMYQSARRITEMLRNELAGVYLPPIPAETEASFTLQEGKLEFFTLAPFLEGNPSLSRAAKVRYEFVKNEESKTITLKRVQQLHSGEKAIGEETSSILEKGLSTFSIRVQDRKDDKWKGEFKSKVEPPKAVLISIAWPGTGKIPSVDIQTMHKIPCQTAFVR